MTHRQHSPAPQPDAPAAWAETISSAALQISHDLILALDAAGTIRYANPAAQQALSQQTPLLGARFVELLDVGSRTKGQRLLDQASAEATPAFELNQIVVDEQVALISYRALRLPVDPGLALADGAGPGWLLVGQPLATTVAATERLIALNRRLSALFRLAAAASRSLVLTDLLREALLVALSELDLRAGAIFLAETPLDLGRAPEQAPEPSKLALAAQQGFTAACAARLAGAEWLAARWQQHVHDGVVDVISGSSDEPGLQPDDLVSAAGPLLSSATVPLTSERQLIGWLYVVTDRYRAMQDDEYELLRTIGNVLGAPVANARLHDELLQASGQLQAVLNTIDSGVLLVDQQTIVRYASTRLGALLNVDVRDWPGRPRAEVMPTTLLPHTQPSALFDGDLWELAGPPPRILRRFAEQVHDASGAALGAIEVYSDVTQLQEMNRLKDEFVAAAAHDLKTPVTAVKGYAQIALRLARRLNDERLNQQLAMINARSDELTLLMDALLDMSRIQAGRMTLDLETIQLSALIESVLRHFEFDLRRRKREIQVAMPEQPLEVLWDQLRMQGVLINLIGNALKYSPEGGPILLSVEAHGPQQGWIALSVTDHGIGIPAEERAHIFDRFYRVRATIEQGFKGTGIGLYIAQHVVELHGGRIWASDALHGGLGTTLHVELPCVVEGDRL